MVWKINTEKKGGGFERSDQRKPADLTNRLFKRYRVLFTVVNFIGFFFIGACVYFLLQYQSLQREAQDDSKKFDCYPEDGASEQACRARGCLWQIRSEKAPLNVPYCFYPPNWHIYQLSKTSSKNKEFQGDFKLVGKSVYGNDLARVRMETVSLDDSILRVKISDPNRRRYEPPYPVRDHMDVGNATSKKLYQFASDNYLPGFKVKRVSDGSVIFNSIGVGGFIFADQFLQISSILPSEYIYGLGSHQTRLKLSVDWTILTFFNADQPPMEQKSLYGSHPFYLVMEESGNCHGVLFLNSNAMDVILQPTPAITFRSIGGIFDIYFFMGPTPEDVLKQYSNVVGKPFLPPFWSLGFHLSKFGLKTLDETRALWSKIRAARIPFDTQWNDLDYMDKNNDFTYDKTKFSDLKKFIEELHQVGMQYIPLIDAGVSGNDENGTYAPYIEGVKQDIFIKDALTKGPFVGKVWNLKSTVWPDYTHPKAKDYYYKMMKMLHDQIPYDGAWIDMNEPSNFYDGTINGCSKNNLDFPPYLPHVNEGLLSKKTVCMNTEHYGGKHYDLHNTYGTSQAVVVNDVLAKIRNKRPFIISRSTWVGHGFYAGHWTGDVFSTWHDMRMSIPAILSMSFYQIPMIGADICGFNGNTTESLCNRWTQLGAFYPFSRNHNSDDTVDQDPVSMGERVTSSAKWAYKLRYTFLSHFYTLFYRAHVFGEPVIRPLFFEFTDDKNTYDIDTCFLWGKHMLILPILQENTDVLTAYIPRGRWYFLEMEAGPQPLNSRGQNFIFEVTDSKMPILMRGGLVVARQESNLTTKDTRKNPVALFVYLNEFGKARGDLYWDDGDSLDTIATENYRWFEFTVDNSHMTSTTKKGRLSSAIPLSSIFVFGLEKPVKHVICNGHEVKFVYFDIGIMITASVPDLKQDFDLAWFFD